MPGASSDQTRGVSGQPHPPPIWSCSGWGLPSKPVSRLLVRSYRTVAPLPRTRRRKSIPYSLPLRLPTLASWRLLPRRVRGGIFSVALALGSPPLGVTQHPALRSSDFPREPPRGHVPAAALLTRVQTRLLGSKYNTRPYPCQNIGLLNFSMTFKCRPPPLAFPWTIRCLLFIIRFRVIGTEKTGISFR